MAGLRDLAQLPDVRRIEAAWGLSTVASTSSTVAVLVYAYAEGGATLVAVYSVARAIWSAVAAMAISGLGDSVGRDRLLRWAMTLRCLLAAAGAAAALVDGPALLAVAAVVAGDGLAAVYRPLQASALPWLVRTPGELAAANVVATVMESTGALVGPALSGVVLLVTDAPTALAVSAGWALLGVVPLLRLRLPEDAREQASGGRHLGRDLAAGASALLNLRPAGGLLTLALAQTIARGVLMVTLVVYAFDVLSVDGSTFGWLNASMGVGGLVGGAIGAVTVRATRLGRTFVVGVTLWGVALLLMAVWPVIAVAFLAMVVMGIGNAHEDASMFTLVPRLVGPRVTGRILGVLELLIAVGIGLGSVIAPRLIDLAGERAGFAVVGGLVLVAAAAYVVPFARVDRSLPQPGPEVQLLRDLPMFAPLPLVVVEQLAGSMTRIQHPAGSAVTQQGGPGDFFHVIASGRVEVEVDGAPRSPLGPGECFGEIALLRASPRTATVTAATDLTTYAMARDDFLQAVAGNRGSAAAADGLAGQRLAADGADGGPGRRPR